MTLAVEHGALKPLGWWRGSTFPGLPDHIQQLPFRDRLELVKQARPDYIRDPRIQQARIAARAELQKGLPLFRSVYYYKPAEMDAMLAYEGPRQIWPNVTPQTQHKLELLRGAKQTVAWDLMRRGALGAPAQTEFETFNTITIGYTDTLIAIMRGLQTGDQTLEIKTVGIDANYDLPDHADTALSNQIGTNKAFDETIISNLQTTWYFDINAVDNNGASTTATGGTSTTIFTVASTTGLMVGDRLEVITTSGTKKTTITDITGSTITVDEALLDIPVNGNQVRQAWGRSGLKGNAAGTTLLTLARFSDGGYAKNNQTPIIVEAAITLKVV